MINYSSNDIFSKYNEIDKKDLFIFLNNWMIEYRNILKISNQINFGVEIEFENIGLTTMDDLLSAYNKRLFINDMWHLKQDVSVDNRDFFLATGGEITSSIMQNKVKFWKQLKDVCTLIKKNGGKISDKEAAHIHFGAHPIIDDKNILLNFLKLWTIYEKVIHRFSYGERTVERKYIMDYSVPLQIIRTNLKNIISLSRYDDVQVNDIIREFYCDRRVAVNFNNVKLDDSFVGNTIEIRCSNGTINEVIWQNNINFFAHLLMISNTSNLDIDRLNYKLKKFRSVTTIQSFKKIYIDDALELADMIFDNNLDKLNFLKQYFKNFKTDDKIIKLTK